MPEAYEYTDEVEEVEEATAESKAEKEEKPKKEEKPAAKAEEEVEESSDEEEMPEYEADARAEGWRPLDEWEGDPDDWVDAKEFNFRGKLMKRIQQQSSQLSNLNKDYKEVKDALRALGEHNKKIAEREYDRALADLKQQKVDALENDDHERAVEIDDKVLDIKNAQKELKEEAEGESDTSTNDSAGDIPPEAQAWLDNPANKWYHDNDVMRATADTLYIRYLEKNPGDVQGALASVEKSIKEEFSHKFNKAKPTKTAVTESEGRGRGQQKNTRSKKYTTRDLDEDQRRVGRTFVDQGVFSSMDEYIEQLVEIGELG